MRSLSRSLDEFDRDAAMQSEARVVNVSPHIARFVVATTPGSQPRRYKLQPGESVHLQSGYTAEFQGAGRQPVRATIESLTERQVWNNGPTLPMVVHESKAGQMRDRWEELLAKGAAPPKPIDVMLPSADGGEPIKMTVQPAPAVSPVSAQAAVSGLPAFDDDEDQLNGPIDEPPPDHNEPLEAVTLPASDGKKGKRG